MFIHRNATSVVRNRYKPIGIEAHFDEIGMPATASSIELSMTSAKR